MASDDPVTVSGFRELHDALGQLPKATERALLRRIGTKALAPFVAEAKRLAPVDDGQLRDSIAAGTKLNSRARRKAKEDPPEGVRVFAGTSNRNGVPREFGTSRSRAEPFMRPAWDRTRSEVLDGVTRDLATEIDKTAKRLAKRAAKKG